MIGNRVMELLTEAKLSWGEVFSDGHRHSHINVTEYYIWSVSCGVEAVITYHDVNIFARIKL